MDPSQEIFAIDRLIDLLQIPILGSQKLLYYGLGTTQDDPFRYTVYDDLS